MAQRLDYKSLSPTSYGKMIEWYEETKKSPNRSDNHKFNFSTSIAN